MGVWLYFFLVYKKYFFPQQILEINPHHSQAQAYFGYILKVYEGDLERGVQLMRRVLRDNKEGNVVNDQKFYFHLGDAFTRLGRLKDAHSVYADAVKYGLFPSVRHLQRGFLVRKTTSKNIF